MNKEPHTAQAAQPASPAHSVHSSDSEGKPVREKLKETRIDAKNSSDPPPSSDQPMKDGSTNGANGNTSGSDSDRNRGRVRRKRSREAFEDEEEAKNPEKKLERHLRKKSRDVTSPVGSDREASKPVKATVSSIRETDGDEQKADVASPKNKRTREQAETSAEAVSDAAIEPSKDATSSFKVEEERTTKRPRDGVDPPVATESQTKIPPGSGFANTSTTSPFATISSQTPSAKPASKPADASAKDVPQTSNQAFKSSGFGSFASASTSPFAAAATGSSSPFGAAAGSKLSSFASGASTPAAKPSGFASLGSSSSGQSAFGASTTGSKSVFGGTLGSNAFGGISTGPSKLSSFGSGGGSITGLTEKPVNFGSKEVPKAAAEDESSTSDKGDDDDPDYQEPERKATSSLLQPQGPIETGEENEDSAWVGRAKLYTLVGEAGKKSWQERGMGPFKLNVTRDEPKRARFVLRADGTHRLLLNAAVTSSLQFGDAEGKEPKDGKILFTAPTAAGEMESYILKLRVEKAAEMWTVVDKVKKDLS